MAKGEFVARNTTDTQEQSEATTFERLQGGAGIPINPTGIFCTASDLFLTISQFEIEV